MNNSKKVIKATDSNNWQVGINYLQTLPKAINFTGTEDVKLLKAYNESLEAFKASIAIKKTSTDGQYEIQTITSKLYGRNIDRLKMLAYETLLKAWSIKHSDHIFKAIQSINDKDELVRTFNSASNKNTYDGVDNHE